MSKGIKISFKEVIHKKIKIFGQEMFLSTFVSDELTMKRAG